MEQLILHLFGDYVTQSDWMATEKTKSVAPAAAHALVYSLPFGLLTQSIEALWVICATHFLIDHLRLARYVVYAKGYLSPRSEWRSWDSCRETGYHHTRPAWLAVWLLIAADNTLHLAINYSALRWL